MTQTPQPKKTPETAHTLLNDWQHVTPHDDDCGGGVCVTSGGAVGSSGEIVARGLVVGTEARVCADIAKRQSLGIFKYGTTVERNPLPLRAWLNHAYEEALDMAIYLKRSMEELDAVAQAPTAAPSPPPAKQKPKRRPRRVQRRPHSDAACSSGSYVSTRNRNDICRPPPHLFNESDDVGGGVGGGSGGGGVPRSLSGSMCLSQLASQLEDEEQT